jgi:hypothetical protein
MMMGETMALQGATKQLLGPMKGALVGAMKCALVGPIKRALVEAMKGVVQILMY